MSYITAKQFAKKYPEFLAREDKSQTFSEVCPDLFREDVPVPGSDARTAPEMP